MDSGVCPALQSTKSDLRSQVPRSWKVRPYSAVFLKATSLMSNPRGGAVPRQSTPFLKYDPLKLVSHVVQKRHDDTQETQKQSKGLFTWR